MSEDWRTYERRILEFLRGNGISIGGDGLGAQHFVIARSAPTLFGGKNAGLPTKCPLCVQIGESCGFEHERVSVETLARFIAGEGRLV